MLTCIVSGNIEVIVWQPGCEWYIHVVTILRDTVTTSWSADDICFLILNISCWSDILVLYVFSSTLPVLACYTCILIHSARIKTKGKDLELVRLSIHATVEQAKFFQLQPKSISAETTQLNFFEVKQKNYKVHGSWLRVNRRSTLVLKSLISSDSQKFANIISGGWRICNQTTL